MDEYGQIRLEDDARELHADLATVALALRAGSPVRLRLAARLTSYNLVLVLAPHAQWLAADPTKILGSQLDRWLLIARERYGAGWVRLGSEVHAADVASAMGTGGPADAPGDSEVLADFAKALAPHILDRHEWDRTALNLDGGGNTYEWACLRCDAREGSSLPDGPEDVDYPCR